ncbi:hypothetical protein D3C87_86050 [compost metagenome]
MEWVNKMYFDIWEGIDKKYKILKIDSIFFTQEENFFLLNQNNISDKAIIKFYSCFSQWKLHWKNKDNINIHIEGIIELQPLEEIFAGHWDETWADTWEGTEIAEDMVGFRPLDSFYEGTGIVGFYINRFDKQGLYLYKEEGEPEPLHVDFEGYLKLLALSKGFGWWQNALIEISTGVHQPNTDSFRENMPEIFPEFNWEEFVALYQTVRIDKK